MISLASLQKVSGGLKAIVAGMRNTINALNNKIDQFNADSNRSQSYISENVKAEREKILPKFDQDLASMRETVANAESHREFWSSRPLLLSRIPFDSNPAVDAQIRLRYAGELAAMDQPLLVLTQKNALVDGDLALVWACEMACRAAGYGRLLDISRVDIPGQAEALALIDACDASLAEAELIVAGASGLSMDPGRKLSIGRRMQPNAPTAHNSPGRATGAA
jgi:hypothetical protein